MADTSSIETKMKRERGVNWLDEEKDFLMVLLEENQAVESKGNDLKTQMRRKKGWQNVMLSFEAKFGTEKSMKKVKDQWGRIKLAAKKECTTYRMESSKTGGGPAPKQLSTLTGRVKALCPLDFEVHQSLFDSDCSLRSVLIHATLLCYPFLSSVVSNIQP